MVMFIVLGAFLLIFVASAWATREGAAPDPRELERELERERERERTDALLRKLGW